MNLVDLIEDTNGITYSGSEAYRFINENGLAGWVLSKKNIQLSEELEANCRTVAMFYYVRYEAYRKELDQFLEVFPSAVPLKGMSLIPRIYIDPVLRCISDIDIYYDSDWNVVREYFLEQGYEIDDDKWEANEFKFVATKLIDGVEVPFEIHRNLLWKSAGDWQFERKVPLPFKSLVAEDELVYLCGHLAYQHTMLSVNWLLDIVLLVKSKKSWNPERISELLEKTPLANSLSSCMWACKKYFNVELPVELSKFVKKDWKNVLIQATLSQEFLMNPSGHRLRYYLLKHLLKESFLDALIYDFLWVGHWVKRKIRA